MFFFDKNSDWMFRFR